MGMDDPCGEGPCGLDVLNLSVIDRPNAPAALAFDGMTKDYILDDDGRYVGAHPVDAKVFLLCRTALRSIKSAPELGQTASLIQYIRPQTIVAEVTDAFRVVLQPVVDAGEIEFRGVEVDTSVRGRIFARPEYFNRVTGRIRPENFPALSL